MQEMAFPGFKFQKFCGGACPRTPLALRVLEQRSLFNLDPPLRHFPLGEFVRAKLSEKKSWQCDWSAKKIATKKLDQFLLFYCSREQIRLVENGLK